MKYRLLVPALASLFLAACSSFSLQTLDSDVVGGLSLIQNATSAAIATGALPKGNVSNIVYDVNTVASGLETVLTGQPLTNSQVTAVAQSFKSNSNTTNYMVAAAPIINALVTTVNAKLNSGAGAQAAVTAGTQLLSNAPAATQAALTSGSTASGVTPSTYYRDPTEPRPASLAVDGWSDGK